jgi:D-glycero-D-manno-heptose 1,7-bisphosphate phosphatase
MNRAVFMDRDGTVIVDVGYPRRPDDVQLLPDALAGLRRLSELGLKLVLISNQSGVGRGLVSPEEAAAVHERFVRELERGGVHLDGAYYCPHAPSDACSCRKPSPEMLERAARELDLDLASSFMVGDRESDLEAGRRAGCKTILLWPDDSPAGLEADHEVTSWLEIGAYLEGELAGTPA